ncbi:MULTISPECIES: response regulator [Bradyrhizobium]|uniref:Response regulator n=1 Tax=Bradyrhizobium frederickii TaxID=2560054 RepID=A0A4Y9NRE1_9BRAD|nr:MULTISPECIES: response regulator [Bradyrhizobium]RTE88690.1 response regulator [Bradyrhizobium sp. LVM 105]TFV70489.1 response regulator [Bradyrhizobium frederickii]
MASVLIVEDEALIGMMIADMLVELGHTIAGQATGLATGVALAQSTDAQAAILDVALGSDSSEAIACVLQKRSIPFAFASGYGAAGVPQEFNERPLLRKPFTMEELAGCLRRLIG